MKARRGLLLLTVLAVLAWPAVAAAQTGGPEQPVIHVVQPGDTLFSIARRYGTTADAIAHANGIADPRQIHAGQRLAIPSAVGGSDNWVTHVVRPGETLEAIAGQYGLDWRRAALANHLLNPHLLSAGQVLRLPVDEATSSGGALHVVQPGETLLHIALQYEVAFWQLAEANWTAGHLLALPGQWLLIPGARPSWMPAPFESVELGPLPVRQGQVLRVAVRTSEPVVLAGALFDRSIWFAQEGDVYYALVGVHAFTEAGVYELALTAETAAGERVSVSSGVVVEGGGYGYERIDVPPGQTDLLDPTVVAAEQARLEELRNLFTPIRRWDGPLAKPVEAAVSSYFGTRRSYNGGPYTSYHGGVDFDAGMGASVRAAADGTVVLAEPLVVRGNAVILDHGWGLLTGYWHLSSIEVAVGQEVRAGDTIARVGSTGLSTGAHLHWEVWVGGIGVDGLQLLSPAYPWDTMGAGDGP